MNEQKAFPFKETIIGGFHFVLKFLKNPIQIMKNTPHIPMAEAITVQGALAALTGLAMGLMAQSIFTLIWGVFLYPIIAIIVCFITSLLLYYGANYLTKRDFKYQEIYTLVFLASIPAYFIRILHPLLASIDLIGLAISSYLLRMGLIYSFGVDRKTASKIVMILYGVLLLGFVIHWLQFVNLQQDLYQMEWKKLESF